MLIIWDSAYSRTEETWQHLPFCMNSILDWISLQKSFPVLPASDGWAIRYAIVTIRTTWICHLQSVALKGHSCARPFCFDPQTQSVEAFIGWQRIPLMD